MKGPNGAYDLVFSPDKGMALVKLSEVSISVVDGDRVASAQLCTVFTSESLRANPYHTAADFFAGYDASNPGCVILDLMLPDMSGLDLLRQSRELGWNFPAIVLTSIADLASAISCLKLGVLDYLKKPFDPREIVEIAKTAIANDIKVHERKRMQETNLARFRNLSPREREIVGLLIAGNSNKQMARLMGLATKTVINHRSHLMGKVGAINAADLVRIATVAGIQPDPRLLSKPRTNVDRGKS